MAYLLRTVGGAHLFARRRSQTNMEIRTSFYAFPRPRVLLPRCRHYVSPLLDVGRIRPRQDKTEAVRHRFG